MYPAVSDRYTGIYVPRAALCRVPEPARIVSSNEHSDSDSFDDSYAVLPQLVVMDLVIRNGIIVDGNGGPAFVGDVGVKDGLVAQVGDLAEVVGIEEIDATGKHVMPGARTATGAVFFSSLSLHGAVRYWC